LYRALLLRPPVVLCLALITIWVWIGAAAWLNESQLNDSLEQFIWAQSFEWGYWKHPPVSTWLVWAVTQWLGPSPYWTYALSALLYAVTVWATYQIAQTLMGRDVAAITALLLTLHYGFTRRAQLYNHNSVLIAFVALMVLATLQALKHPSHWRWVWVGVLAGVAMLVKYQALIPILGVVLSILLTGQLKAAWRGLGLAALCALLVCSPHLYWLATHDFMTLTYAMHYVENAEFSARSYRQGAFFVNQLRFYLPMMFFLVLLWFIRWVIKAEKTIQPPTMDRDQRAWVIGLLGFPFLTIVFVAAAMGVNIQSHWGLQTSQFLCLPVAFWLVQRQGGMNRAKLIAWGLVQFVAFGIFVAQGAGLLLYATTGLAVRELPARTFARETLAFWSSKTPCPLHYLSGQSAMVAMISAYSGQNLKVLEDGAPKKSPWVDLSDMLARGYIEVSVAQDPVTDVDTHVVPFQFQSVNRNDPQVSDHLILKYRAPQGTCP
jgi:4-amino-4-deoxy-L-arabinose transferase-like glycosyltransferase